MNEYERILAEQQDTRTAHLRPEVDEPDLGFRYRETTNRTGKCPGCDVEVEVVEDPAVPGVRQVNFRHDDDCPVVTSAAKPDYTTVHGEIKVGRNSPCPCGSGKKFKQCCGVKGTPLDQRVEAASAETRKLMAKAGIGDGSPAPQVDKWAEDLLDDILRTSTFCDHIRSNPTQPSYAFHWERAWRCKACLQDHAARQQREMQQGTYTGLGVVEENTCDLCRKVVGVEQLTTSIMRVSYWVLTMALCPECSQEWIDKGGRLAGP